MERHGVICKRAPVVPIPCQQRQLVVRAVVVDHRGVDVLRGNVVEQQHALLAALAAVRVAQLVHGEAWQPLDDCLPVGASQTVIERERWWSARQDNSL